MTGHSIQSVLVDLWGDLRQPDILWQVATLAACLVLAWLLSRLVRVKPSAAQSRALKLGAGGFNRIVFALVAVVLLLAARAGIQPWAHTNLLSVAIPVFGSLAAIRFVVYLLRLVFAPGGWLAVWERAITTLAWVAVALYLTGLLPELRDFLDGINVSIGKQRFSVLRATESVLWVLLTLLVAMWAGSAAEGRLMRTEGLHMSLRVVLARVIKAGTLVVAVLIVLPLVGIDLTVLSVFGGALGVGLGLGLQKIASNYVSGFILLLDRSVRLGDWITVGDHHGEVKRITTRYTVVRAPTGVEAIIPNDTLITSTVLNTTLADKDLRVAVRVSVAYSSPIEEVLRVLEELAGRHERVLDEPAPVAQVLSLGDNGIDIELGFWIGDQEKGRQNICSDLHIAILNEFKARGIQIPFPQREVRVLAQEAS